MEGRIFILGSSGFIGSHLSHYYKQAGYSIFDSNSFMLRTDNKNHVKRVLNLTRPDYLIYSENCELSSNIEETLSTMDFLFNACKDLDIHCLYLGCDTVFQGREESYQENDRIFETKSDFEQKVEIENLIYNSYLSMYYI